MTNQPTRRAGHRRRSRKGTVIGASAVATAIVAGVVVTFAASASAASPGAVYSRTSAWEIGYTGQYLVTNPDSKAIDGWTLSFDLPAGARIDSLWNATFTATGQHVTVKPQDWGKRIEPGKSLDVGFVVQGSGAAQAEPANCLINDAPCTAGSTTPPTPSGRPTTATPTPTASPTPTVAPTSAKPTPTPTVSPTPTASASTPPPVVTNGHFAPYVDTSLYPPFDLVATAKATGVKNYTLAFVVSGGGCTPKWGGVSDLGADAVASQIGALRAIGGDVRVSFGGANGSELATACSSVAELTAAYQKTVDAYGATKVDFDVEGGALGDVAANTRRAQAIVQLQKNAASKGKTLDVSYTLPALPSGLTQDGVNLVANAKSNGVAIGAVNIMAMDYGDGAAPNPQGRMGKYAIDAATATQAQLKSVLGLADAAAWAKVAVTPMIGVNDVASEIFTVADATQLAEFAKTKHLAWLAMWSGTRDKACAGGAKPYADASCSSIAQQPLDFTRAFGAYTG
ncbi:MULTISPECIES: cellulose binding domain-containing protein [unclassified Kitasatospora]|uniref:cellulose binding domain-containing protein n=1 Tax=unclassified Kitasatospora TaxID=2633591 RepID=UPI00070F93A4|nr:MULTISPECIES: cellulose binding domain-containing protein [unclassified Kitasatospora]KQV11694.1 sugar hydrolase [Kitasatospora sp. Root107]KRB76724.1 sugar hydrolase [Kitasatospora sp. Root187]